MAPKPHQATPSLYMLGHDNPEYERLQDQHDALMEFFFHDPIHAPLSNESNILKIVDIGCGVNAGMTRYFATKFPDALVYGVDLAAIDRKDFADELPPNIEFIQGNFLDLALQDHRLHEGTVDFVYSRFLVSAMKDWQQQIDLVAQVLAPGGWMEIHDFDSVDYSDSKDRRIDSKWNDELTRWCESSGLDWHGLDNVEVKLQKAGLSDVQRKNYRLPLAPVSGHPEMDAYAQYANTGLPRAFWTVGSIIWAGESDEFRKEMKKSLWESHRRVEGNWIPFIIAWAKRVS